MKKVLIILTGGTITSAEGDDGLAPVPGRGILDELSDCGDLCEILTMGLFALDSTDIGPGQWQEMVCAVCGSYEDCDGFVLLHGTDTMAYTAAALSFALAGIGKPVILTGAQIPLGMPFSDARRNMRDAVCAACSDHIAGVYVVFDGALIKGTRAVKADARGMHAFVSSDGHTAGRIEGTDVILETPESLVSAASAWDASYRPECRNSFEEGVRLIKVYPGMDAGLLSAENAAACGIRAVVRETFGLGGVPERLTESVKKLTQAQIAVFAASQCVYGGTDLGVYSVGARAQAAGVVSAQTMSAQTAAVKLMWILGQTHDAQRIRELFLEDIAGELS